MRIAMSKYFLILILLVMVPATAFSGPPDQEAPPSPGDLDLLRDSLENDVELQLLLVDSLTNHFDSLYRFPLDLYDTIELPSFPEIIIDENGIIKVMTDSGMIIYSIDTNLTANFPEYYDETYLKRPDITRWGKSIVVDEGERIISNIVLFSGDVTVNGSVEGDVVVIGGDIFINSTGYVRGDAVAVGGRVKKEDGAKVTGSTISIGAPFLIRPHGSVFQVIQGIMLLTLITSLFFSALSTSLFTRPVRRISDKLTSHPIKSFLLGYLIYLGSFLVWLLLLVSVIGIPLALIGQPIAMLLLVMLAYAAPNVVLGEKVFRQNSPLKAYFWGSLITTGLPLILLLLGYLSNLLALFIINMVFLAFLLFILLPFGLGAASMARFGFPPRVKQVEGEPGQAVFPEAGQTG